MNIVEEFTDEGYSGARFGSPGFGPLGRPGGASSIRSAVDLLYESTGTEVRAAGPHSRGLERFGARAIFLEGGAVDDPLSKLLPQITGAVAEFERAKITERNRRGRLYRARCGEIVCWKVPFGYVRVPLVTVWRRTWRSTRAKRQWSTEFSTSM
jgi:site-specific DNA recombinase